MRRATERVSLKKVQFFLGGLLVLGAAFLLVLGIFVPMPTPSPVKVSIPWEKFL